jgi:hypothetical protein
MVGVSVKVYIHLIAFASYVVEDSLDYEPERCTMVATYKRLVVGVLIMSSPRETYITYVAVKPGWDSSGIGT